MASLLNVVILKLRYDEDTDWGTDEDEPEEEALFFEMRKVKLTYYLVKGRGCLFYKCIEFKDICRTHCCHQRRIIRGLHSLICHGYV